MSEMKTCEETMLRHISRLKKKSVFVASFIKQQKEQHFAHQLNKTIIIWISVNALALIANNKLSQKASIHTIYKTVFVSIELINFW